MPVAAAAAAVAAAAAEAAVAVAAATMAAVAAMTVVDNEDGIQWRWWEGRLMVAAAFDGNGDGLRIGKRGKDGG